MKTAANVAAQSGNYGLILDILRSAEKLNNGKLSETEYFNVAKTIVDAATVDTAGAFDSIKYLHGDSAILAYNKRVNINAEVVVGKPSYEGVQNGIHIGYKSW